MHPEFSHALARQRIEEAHRRAPRPRRRRLRAGRRRSWLDKLQLSHDRALGRQLESEAR